jgi:hypothetical protein
MNTNKISGFSNLESLNKNAIKQGEAVSLEDAQKKLDVLLKELHISANLCSITTNSTAALALTMAKFASLQVCINKDSERLQNSIRLLTCATVFLTIVQIVLVVFQMYFTIISSTAK